MWCMPGQLAHNMGRLSTRSIILIVCQDFISYCMPLNCDLNLNHAPTSLDYSKGYMPLLIKY